MGARSQHLDVNWIKLICILLLSWGLLVWQLGERSLWVDEYLTLRMIQGTLADVAAACIGDKHPPLYFVILHGWVGLVGSTDFALRLFSAMSAMLGLALVSQVARRLFGPRAVVWAALILGVAPAFVEFSRMARYYSFLLSLGLLSTYLLLRALARNDWRNWIAYAVASLTMPYTFYPGVIVIGAHAIVVLIHRDRRILLGPWLVAGALMGLGCAPWFYSVAASQVGKLSGGVGADLSRSLVGFALGIASAFYTFGVGETLFPWRPEAWIGLTTVFVLLAVSLLRRIDPKCWQCFALFIISIVFVSGVTSFVNVGTPFLNVPVRGLFALPYYLLTIVGGLLKLKSAKWRGALGTVLLAVWSLGIFNSFTEQQFLNPIYITPAKRAAAFVLENAAPGDWAISDFDSIFGHYFLAGEGSLRHFYTREVDSIGAALQKSAPPRIWLVTIGRDQTLRLSSAPEVRQRLEHAHRLESVERYLPIDPVYLRIKNLILRRKSYEHRLTVETYILIEE